jgi:RNA polymerase sigma-70 factor (ECF subfamily)
MNAREPDNRETLTRYITDHADTLMPSLRVFVARGGMTKGNDIDAEAHELLNEVVVEALHHAERFDPGRQAKAWLLGIAANLIKRNQAETAKRERREPLARDLVNTQGDLMSDGEVFDLLTDIGTSNPAAEYERRERMDAMLSGVSKADQHSLRLAILSEMDGETLANALKITPGAARVRLHRAINRLRAANPVKQETE